MLLYYPKEQCVLLNNYKCLILIILPLSASFECLFHVFTFIINSLLVQCGIDRRLIRTSKFDPRTVRAKT